MDSRELLVLIEGLPDDSEYKRSLAGYPFGVERDWSPDEYRMARLITEVAVANNSLDLDAMVSPVERAVVAMKENGEWPPQWWPDDWKKDALEASAPREEPVSEEAFEAVHNVMLNQLYGRS